MGFVVCATDMNVFIRRTPDVVEIVLVFVDDLLVFSTGDPMNVYDGLAEVFATKVVYDVTKTDFTYIGFDIHTELNANHEIVSVKLSQETYIKKAQADLTKVTDIRKLFPNMSKYRELPDDPRYGIPPDADEEIKDAKELAKTIKILQQVIGKIAHVVYKSRPDVSFALTNSTKYILHPTPTVIKHIEYQLQYLFTTASQPLVIQTPPHLQALSANSDVRLDIFTDSSYAADKLFRCQYGYLIYMNHTGLINFGSTTSTNKIASSSNESELESWVNAHSQVQGTINLLQDLGIGQVKCHYLMDNLGSTLFLNGVITKANWCFARHLHLYRQTVTGNELVKVTHTKRDNNPSDILTHNASKDSFVKFRARMFWNGFEDPSQVKKRSFDHLLN